MMTDIDDEEWYPYGSPPEQHISEIVMRLDDRDCVGVYDRKTCSYVVGCLGLIVNPVMWRDVRVGREKPARLPMFRGWMVTSERWVQAAMATTREDYMRYCYSRAADAAGMAFLFLDKTKIKTLNIIVAHWASVLQRAGRFRDALLVGREFLNDERLTQYHRTALWRTCDLATFCCSEQAGTENRLCAAALAATTRI